MLSDAHCASQRRRRWLDWFATRHIARSNRTVFGVVDLKIRLIPVSALERTNPEPHWGFNMLPLWFER
jgi:hypothetical protein